MHIPDGYLSPATFSIGYLVAIPLWKKAFDKLVKVLNEETLPLIASLTALSFVIMMFNIPIPGGTSGHAIGTALISVIFGPEIAFLSISLVLFIQAIIFGDGGVSSFAINALAMGYVASYSAYYIIKLNIKYKYFLAGWTSAVTSSIVIAFALGIQPYISTDINGKPLFFPFDLPTTFYALVGSHIIFFGLVEGIFTSFAYKFLVKLEPKIKKDLKVDYE